MLIKMQTNFVHTRTHTYTHPNTPHSHRHRCCLSRRGALNLSHLKYDDKQKRTQSRIQTKRNEIKLHFYLQMLCTSAQRECDANEWVPVRMRVWVPVWMRVCVNDGVVFRNNTAKAKNGSVEPGRIYCTVVDSVWLLAKQTKKRVGKKNSAAHSTAKYSAWNWEKLIKENFEINLIYLNMNF